jgi:hypothetical protein
LWFLPAGYKVPSVNADFAAGTIVSNVTRPYSIREDHRIIDRSTVHASRSLELHLADIVDEIRPVLDYQSSTPCAWHNVFSSPLCAVDARLSHFKSTIDLRNVQISIETT